MLILYAIKNEYEFSQKLFHSLKFIYLLQVSLTECSSTPLVSENEKGETTINVEDPGSISDVVWDEYQVRKQQILLKNILTYLY